MSHFNIGFAQLQLKQLASLGCKCNVQISRCNAGWNFWEEVLDKEAAEEVDKQLTTGFFVADMVC